MKDARASKGVRRVVDRIRDDRGFSLPEILVGVTLSGLISVATLSAVFTTNDLGRRADDRNSIASAFSIVTLVLDRDGAMALGSATAKSQTSSTACTTTMDLGVQEGGASIRFRTVAQGTDGPYWFQRLSGAGTKTLAKNVSACTWQTVQDASGKWMIRVDLTMTGSTGESAAQTFRVVPRLW
jgi:prepilin-type N-terminal cleavage/methylation domain-containing protein